jgi:DNA-binding transcriptional MerR regulator
MKTTRHVDEHDVPDAREDAVTRAYRREQSEPSLPLYSIGGVSRMLGLSAGTIRTWEARYGLVVPARSAGGQRLYSRDQIEQLRFVQGRIRSGRRPGEAHRLLAERLRRGDSFGGTRTRVLLAERRLGASAGLVQLLGPDGFEVILAQDPESAEQAIEELGPTLVVIDTGDEAFDALSQRLRETGTKILPAELLEQPLALFAEARSLFAT